MRRKGKGGRRGNKGNENEGKSDAKMGIYPNLQKSTKKTKGERVK